MPRSLKKPSMGKHGLMHMRIDIPRAIWVLAERLASASKRDPGDVVRQLLNDVNSQIIRGKSQLFGPEIALHVPEVAKTLRFEQELELSTELMVDGEPIDIALIHTNPKLKSGFVGVFGNGQGFRAMAKDPKTQGAVLIGYYSTALEAAWARRQHHVKHDIPYGPWAELYEAHRLKYPFETIHDSKAFCAWLAGCGKFPSVGIPEDYIHYYGGEMPVPSTASLDPDPQDIASINAKAAKRAKEIAEQKRAERDESERLRLESEREKRLEKEADEVELTEEQIMASAGKAL